MKFRAATTYSGVPELRHYEITGNSTGQRTITIDLTEQEIAVLNCRDIEVTIEPVKSREERLREARAEALYRELDMGDLGKRAIAVIERVDAEFAKGDG